MSTVLVTGGTGFIGSHTCVALIESGYDVVIVDNLYNSKKEACNRIYKITEKEVKFYEVDCCDKEALRRVFEENKIDSVIHFAGLKAVGESVKIPAAYYRNNIDSILTVMELMKEFGVKNIVFSSSATVYGSTGKVPLSEDSPLGECTNPYGWTKWMIERILTDIAYSDPSLNVVLLRYFNPVGAHESGLLGEDPQGIPNNLFPNVARAAAGMVDCLNVFGNDYDTPDGTCIRDYIHVCDLADGHVKALDYVATKNGGRYVFNLGTGNGYSVSQVITAYEKACGKKINYKFAPRREGDLPVSYADPAKANKELGFKTKYDIDKMCEDSWRWQTMNPNGLE